MYLKRKIDGFLKEWKTSIDRKPLIIKGPRQVGKTKSIREFASLYYKNVVEINFVTEPKYKRIIDDGYNADNILRNISILDPDKNFIPSDTLLFFDEIQDFPEIATSLKFFKEDGRFDIICSGSMLGLNYKRIESNSVGYKTDYVMYSLDFEEFLWAKGYKEDFIDSLLTSMLDMKALSSTVMQVCSDLFMDYILLGGMPAVVRDYILKKNLSGSLETQRQLSADYREDIRKYADGMDQTRILNVYNRIPVQLSKENKKFQLSKVEKGARFKDYRGCVEWLESAGIVNICRCLSYPELPLKGNTDDDVFKIYSGDTGLFISMLDDEAQEDLRANKNLSVYKGALYESIASEALVKAGYGLFYYKKENSTLEEDFFVRTAEYLIPVEVKAVNGQAKSLRTLISSPAYPDISFGIKFINGNIGYDNRIFTFPLFCIFLLKRFLAHFDVSKFMDAETAKK